MYLQLGWHINIRFCFFILRLVIIIFLYAWYIPLLWIKTINCFSNYVWLFCQHSENCFIKSTLAVKIVDVHGILLSQTMHSVFCLSQNAWCPRQLCKYNSWCWSQRYPSTAGCDTQQRNLHSIWVLKFRNQLMLDIRISWSIKPDEPTPIRLHRSLYLIENIKVVRKNKEFKSRLNKS